MNLKEIARQANVSVSTVSRVIKPEKHKGGKSRSSGTHLGNCTQKRLYSQCHSPKSEIGTESSDPEHNPKIHCLHLCKKQFSRF